MDGWVAVGKVGGSVLVDDVAHAKVEQVIPVITFATSLAEYSSDLNDR